jgi:hypothetical protein
MPAVVRNTVDAIGGFLPALVSVLCGFDPAGTPLAIQLIARPARTNACCASRPCSSKLNPALAAFRPANDDVGSNLVLSARILTWG